jgi:outer membrane protein assembly factor BamB
VSALARLRPVLRAAAAGARAAALAGAAAACASGCGGPLLQNDHADTRWIDGRPRAEVADGPMRVRWSQRITPETGGSYQPVERAEAALDPARDRVYVGSSAGFLYALTSRGRRVWRYDARGGIESRPALDAAADALFAATAEGKCVALRASDGAQRWEVDVPGPVTTAPVLSADAVYVATANDFVVALRRSDGEELWRYRRDVPEGFALTGHAGLVLAAGMVLTGFSDGFVVALDLGSGQPAWERDTAIDLDPEVEATGRFLDVDTTPVVVGDSVWVASFSAGLYELALGSGSVLWRDAEQTGIVGLAAAGPSALVLSSAEAGIVRFDLETREATWRRRVRRGAAGPAVVAGGVVLVGENLGGFLALRLSDGREVGRLESGYGFTAAASVAGALGFVVSNGGGLYAFALDRG